MYLAGLFGLILGVIHLISDKIHIRKSSLRNKLVSFGAGVSISYIFLSMLPTTYHASIYLEELVFVFLLIGFAIFHIAEKYIYKHAAKEKLRYELKEEHSIAFFFYYFIVGIALFYITQANAMEGLLFFIPLAIHAGLSSLSMRELHGKMKESFTVKSLLSAAPLAGMVFAKLVVMPVVVFNAILSFIIGVFLYIVIRELLPEKKKGEPTYFILGMVLFGALIYLTKFALI